MNSEEHQSDTSQEAIEGRRIRVSAIRLRPPQRETQGVANKIEKFLTDHVQRPQHVDTITFDEVLNTLKRVWIPPHRQLDSFSRANRNCETKMLSSEEAIGCSGKTSMMMMTTTTSEVASSPIVLRRRRLSAPETIMRKHTLAQQRLDEGSDGGTPPSTATRNSDQNLRNNNNDAAARDLALNRQSTLVRRLYDNENDKTSQLPPKTAQRSQRSSPKRALTESAAVTTAHVHESTQTNSRNNLNIISNVALSQSTIDTIFDRVLHDLNNNNNAEIHANDDEDARSASDDDTLSLVDSLEEEDASDKRRLQRRPRGHDGKPVRGAILSPLRLPLPDNSGERSRTRKSATFYVPLDAVSLDAVSLDAVSPKTTGERTEVMGEEVVRPVADLLPAKVRARLSRRQVKREQRIAQTRTQPMAPSRVKPLRLPRIERSAVSKSVVKRIPRRYRPPLAPIATTNGGGDKNRNRSRIPVAAAPPSMRDQSSKRKTLLDDRSPRYLDDVQAQGPRNRIDQLIANILIDGLNRTPLAAPAAPPSRRARRFDAIAEEESGGGGIGGSWSAGSCCEEEEEEEGVVEEKEGWITFFMLERDDDYGDVVGDDCGGSADSAAEEGTAHNNRSKRHNNNANNKNANNCRQRTDHHHQRLHRHHHPHHRRPQRHHSKRNEWSVTVSGANNFDAHGAADALPELEMRLKLPGRRRRLQRTFDADSSGKTARNRDESVTRRRAKLPELPGNKCAFPPSMEDAVEVMALREENRRLCEILKRLPTLLKVTGSAISPERKPRVTTMSERDLTRNLFANHHQQQQ